MVVVSLAPLFDGDDALFKRTVTAARAYFEYGMGASTFWVLENTEATVRAVDTSESWVNSVRSRTSHPDRLHAQWIDVGPLGDWGMPVSYAKRGNFRLYVEGPWQGGQNPDVVLVDGRFRVCCFLHSLLSAAPGTRILFDDYHGRPWYRVVEEFVRPADRCGRQAMFVVPNSFDRDEATKARDHFLYVRE